MRKLSLLAGWMSKFNWACYPLSIVPTCQGPVSFELALSCGVPLCPLPCSSQYQTAGVSVAPRRSLCIWQQQQWEFCLGSERDRANTCKLVAKDQGALTPPGDGTPPPSSHGLCLVNAQSKSFLMPEELGLMRGFCLSQYFELQTGQGHPEVGAARDFETNACQPRAGIPSRATTEPPKSRTATGLSGDAKGTWLHKPAPCFVPAHSFWEAGEKHSMKGTAASIYSLSPRDKQAM